MSNDEVAQEVPLEQQVENLKEKLHAVRTYLGERVGYPKDDIEFLDWLKELEGIDSREYVEDVLRTESNDFGAISARLSDPTTIRLLHSAMGMSTEANEFLDHMKKVIFYGKELDFVNIEEEIGDSEWYKSIGVDELQSSFRKIWRKNIAKLKARYEGKFNETKAEDRDLDKERKILEGKQDGEENG